MRIIVGVQIDKSRSYMQALDFNHVNSAGAGDLSLPINPGDVTILNAEIANKAWLARAVKYDPTLDHNIKYHNIKYHNIKYHGIKYHRNFNIILLFIIIL